MGSAVSIAGKYNPCLIVSKPGFAGTLVCGRPTVVIGNRIVNNKAHAAHGPALADRNHSDVSRRSGLVIPCPRQPEKRVTLTGLRKAEEFHAMRCGLIWRWDWWECVHRASFV